MKRRRGWLILIVSNYLHTGLDNDDDNLLQSHNNWREEKNEFDEPLSDGDNIYFDRQV